MTLPATQVKSHFLDRLQVQVFWLEPAVRLLDCCARDGNIDMSVCLERDVEQGQLRAVVSHIQFLEMSRPPCAFWLQVSLNLLALGVVPVSKVDMCAKTVVQGYCGCTYALCASCVESCQRVCRTRVRVPVCFEHWGQSGLTRQDDDFAI